MMSPSAVTVAMEQPNVPSPGPLRTVTITLQAELPVSSERWAQHAVTILIGPPAELYLGAQVFPNAVDVAVFAAGVAAWWTPAVPAEPQPDASRQRSVRVSPSCRTCLILTVGPGGGK